MQISQGQKKTSLKVVLSFIIISVLIFAVLGLAVCFLYFLSSVLFYLSGNRVTVP